MKLIFFSSDPAEVERLGGVLTGEGIPCEIRTEIRDLHASFTERLASQEN